jgi:hypothetical protein
MKRAGILLLALTLSAPSYAFKLSTEGTAMERKLSRMNSSFFDKLLNSAALKGLPLFTEAVHEEITQRIYGCEGDTAFCQDADLGMASPYVIAGVRWNDDPPFRLLPDQAKNLPCKTDETVRFITQPKCWAGLFWDAEKRAKSGVAMDASNGYSLLHRSHFGDLQFLHAMASKDGEPPEVTRQKILMWAEFSWRIALREYGLDTRLRDVKIDGFTEHFGKTEWNVQDLFTLGNVALRRNIDEVAFGSLLHVVEDSFAAGHVERAEPIYGKQCNGSAAMFKPGSIAQFHAYGNQDTDLHAQADSSSALNYARAASQGGVIEVGRNLVAMLDKNLPWDSVKPYLECVFELKDSATPASAGSAFHKID